MNKFKLGDIIFCPYYDTGDMLVVSIERDYYKVIGLEYACDGRKDNIYKINEWLYDVVGNIFEKKSKNALKTFDSW